MITRDRIAALLFLAFSIAYGLQAQTIELYFGAEADPLNARTFPTALAWIGGAFALLLLVSPARAAEVSIADLLALDWARLAALCVLMVGYGLTIQSVGFFVSTSVFLIAGYLLLGERRPMALLAGSLPVAAALQWILHGLLGIYIADPTLEAVGIIAGRG